MSLTVSADLLQATRHKAFASERAYSRSSRVEREYAIDVAGLTNEALSDLLSAAKAVKDGKTERAIEAIAAARDGVFGAPVPNFKAFLGVLEAFLKHEIADGWIYVTGEDGKIYPELVTDLEYDEGEAYRGKGNPTVRIRTAYYGLGSSDMDRKEFGLQTMVHSFSPHEVANRRVSDILASKDIYRETSALRKAYDDSMARHRKVTQPAFAQQFRLSGKVLKYEESSYERRGQVLQNRKVIHDLDPAECGAFSQHAESALFSGRRDPIGRVPEHPVIRVFDLKTHDFLWVHADLLTPYVYDKSLRNKLVLPHSHRDLLDVLTTDLDAFVNDIIEGKSAGNVILCKGIPGVGKTLTAEVYSELIERPLYSIHSGSLGTSAEEVAKNLQTIFLRAKRWNCVLLLDEADVFVVQRGNNIEQNAIVAEFLRTLEYFDGLMFMTTNRPDDIDDAIISRCGAIIVYNVPDAGDAAEIWNVMAAQYGVKLNGGLLSELLALFPKITPRDIKMLLRLALRVAKKHHEALTIDIFRRCAMFRAITMAGNSITESDQARSGGARRAVST